jgi:hypothetical protein
VPQTADQRLDLVEQDDGRPGLAASSGGARDGVRARDRSAFAADQAAQRRLSAPIASVEEKLRQRPRRTVATGSPRLSGPGNQVRRSGKPGSGTPGSGTPGSGTGYGTPGSGAG